MVRDYELMYIVRPELDEEALQAATASVETLIAGVGGSVVRSTSWGRRRLAYEVDHLRDGHYMLLHLRVDGARIAEIERALSIHDTVFRHLLVIHETSTEVDEVDPDSAPAPVAAGDDDVPADDDAAADDGDDEPDATPPTRQAAVAAEADDEDQGERGSATAAATEEEN